MSSTSTTISLGNPVVQNLQSRVVMLKENLVEIDCIRSIELSYSSNHACPLELGFSADDILLCELYI